MTLLILVLDDAAAPIFRNSRYAKISAADRASLAPMK